MMRLLALAAAALAVGCAAPYPPNCTPENILRVGNSVNYVTLQCGVPSDRIVSYIDGIGTRTTLIYCQYWWCPGDSALYYLDFENGALFSWTLH